jgi:hypothetical protein
MATMALVAAIVGFPQQAVPFLRHVDVAPPHDHAVIVL